MKRLISPHVDIYKFPITAISSITTRITGLGLTGYFVLGGISGFNNHKYLKQKYDQLGKVEKNIVNYLVVFPGVYHTCGGIRHFVWDKFPHLMTNKKVALSSYVLFGLSTMITILSEKALIN
mgnify:FL=1|tara:strand:+ start:191 stop:556 length:366 start_codon:yes stop_codon:yes gene_type:complete